MLLKHEAKARVSSFVWIRLCVLTLYKHVSKDNNWKKLLS